MNDNSFIKLEIWTSDKTFTYCTTGQANGEKKVYYRGVSFLQISIVKYENIWRHIRYTYSWFFVEYFVKIVSLTLEYWSRVTLPVFSESTPLNLSRVCRSSAWVGFGQLCVACRRKALQSMYSESGAKVPANCSNWLNKGLWINSVNCLIWEKYGSLDLPNCYFLKSLLTE